MLLNLRDDHFGYVNRVEALSVQRETGVRASLFFQETGRCTVGTHHNLATADVLIFLQHRAVGLHNARIDQTEGIGHALVTFVVGKINGYIAADGIELLAGRNLVHEGDVIPTEAEDGLRTCFPSLLDSSRNHFVQKRIRGCSNGHCSYDGQGNTYGIMGMTVAATGHHQTLV